MPSDFRFGELELSEPVRHAVWDAGYREPMPIQATAVPHLLPARLRRPGAHRYRQDGGLRPRLSWSG
jgi:superfamily II DNA/RNA helicase